MKVEIQYKSKVHSNIEKIQSIIKEIEKNHGN